MLKEYFTKFIIISFLVLILFLVFNNDFDLWKIRRNIEPVKYQTEIDKYAAKFSLEPELLAAIIYVESRFDKYSLSPKGAVGLMQLMPSTAFWVAEELGYNDFQLEDLEEVELNIKFGSWYFSYLYHKFDQDLIKTIAAYNAGESNVRNWIKAGWGGDIKEKLPYNETDNFVRRVISTRDYYRKVRFNLFGFSSLKFLLADSFE